MFLNGGFCLFFGILNRRSDFGFCGVEDLRDRVGEGLHDFSRALSRRRSVGSHTLEFGKELIDLFFP